MKLFKHQQEALTRSEGQNRVAFFHDMGLGKTFTGAEKMMQLGARVNLIVCQKSKIRDWIEHLDKHYRILNERVLREFFDLTNLEGFTGFLAANAFGSQSFVGVINYELAWRRPELLKLRNFTLMLDESSLIQNRKAKQSNFILKLGEHAENVILLSGTPTAGKYENLWTQCKLLGWNISERAYNSQFVNWKTQKIGWMNPKIIRVVDKVNPYKNVDRLKRKLREHGAQFLKTEECFELPEQTFIEVNISKPSIYDKFVKKSVVNVGDEVLIGDTTLTKRLYCRELCGIYSEEKRQAFREILQSTNERLIVFYNFDRERMILIEECMKQDRPVSVVSGVEKDLTAYETESDSVTLIQYQAGAMGLNLQKSNKVIYYALPERSELFEQSKKRIHRIGQNKPCFYYVMMCKDTVEPDIYTTLKLRKDYTDELFRESERKWERKRISKIV